MTASKGGESDCLYGGDDLCFLLEPFVSTLVGGNAIWYACGGGGGAGSVVEHCEVGYGCDVVSRQGTEQSRDGGGG